MRGRETYGCCCCCAAAVAAGALAAGAIGPVLSGCFCIHAADVDMALAEGSCVEVGGREGRPPASSHRQGGTWVPTGEEEEGGEKGEAEKGAGGEMSMSA